MDKKQKSFDRHFLLDQDSIKITFYSLKLINGHYNVSTIQYPLSEDIKRTLPITTQSKWEREYIENSWMTSKLNEGLTLYDASTQEGKSMLNELENDYPGLTNNLSFHC